jgi:hypothetical protein
VFVVPKNGQTQEVSILIYLRFDLLKFYLNYLSKCRKSNPVSYRLTPSFGSSYHISALMSEATFRFIIKPKVPDKRHRGL